MALVCNEMWSGGSRKCFGFPRGEQIRKAAVGVGVTAVQSCGSSAVASVLWEQCCGSSAVTALLWEQ